jgi:hypothetical protein
MVTPFTWVENVQFAGQYFAQSKLLSLYGLGYCEEFKTVRGWLAPSKPGQLMAVDQARSVVRWVRYEWYGVGCRRGLSTLSIVDKSPLHSLTRLGFKCQTSVSDNPRRDVIALI